MRARPRTALALTLVLTTVLAGVAPRSAAGAPPAESERLVALLRDAVEVRPDRRRPGTDPSTTGLVQDDQLNALRLLHDPGLRPLFQSLAESAHPQLRIHGVLGCAEIDPAHHVDTFLLRRIKSPIEQAYLFGQAARQDLVGVEQCREILAWSELAPELEVQARSRLLALGEPADVERLAALSQNGSAPIAAMAGLLLMHAGKADLAQPSIDRFFASPVAAVRGVLPTILQYVRREKLTGGAPFVERAMESTADDPRSHMECALTLLTIAPTRGVDIWSEGFAQATDQAERIFWALAALDASDTAPPELYDPLLAPGAGELLNAMGRAGRAVASHTDAADALAALVRQNHGPSIVWAAHAVETLPAEQRPRADRALISVALESPRSNLGLRAALAPAAARLAESEPRALADLIRESAERADDALCQSLLAGALRSNSSAPPLPDSTTRWPSAPCRSLATLVRARFTLELTPEEQESLRLVALGSDLSRLFRVQAAWLALKHSGQDRVCLAKVLAPDPE